jgi:hypothetical protein
MFLVQHFQTSNQDEIIYNKNKNNDGSAENAMGMNEIVKQFVISKQNTTTKVRLNIVQMEADIRARMNDYYDEGGYHSFYRAIKEVESMGLVLPLKGNAKNGRTPALSLQYWIHPRSIGDNWDSLQMMKLGDNISFAYYKRHPEWQTTEEWAHVERVHNFLQTVEEREWVSVEERSLELFGHEKYLADEGSGLLKRLGISLASLKARKWGEPFVFWLRTGTQLQDIRQVLIVENLSFFHTAVSLLKKGVLTPVPDVIIYGEGKKIENSFSFFYELFPSDTTYTFRYVGDMDPEGYGIYYRLHHGYELANIGLASEIYEAMSRYHDQAVPCENHFKDQKHLDFMLEQLATTNEAATRVSACWNEDKRIPQEVITVETWRKGRNG